METLLNQEEMYAPNHPVSIFINLFANKVGVTSEVSQHKMPRQKTEVESNIKRMLFSPRNSADHEFAMHYLISIAKNFRATNRYVPHLIRLISLSPSMYL